jgi:predicted RNase H-like nuclease (RuvC/YqgF family)
MVPGNELGRMVPKKPQQAQQPTELQALQKRVSVLEKQNAALDRELRAAYDDLSSRIDSLGQRAERSVADLSRHIDGRFGDFETQSVLAEKDAEIQRLRAQLRDSMAAAELYKSIAPNVRNIYDPDIRPGGIGVCGERKTVKIPVTQA